MQWPNLDMDSAETANLLGSRIDIEATYIMRNERVGFFHIGVHPIFARKRGYIRSASDSVI